MTDEKKLKAETAIGGRAFAILIAESERLRNIIKLVSNWRQDAADMDSEMGYVGAEKTVFGDAEQWEALEKFTRAALEETGAEPTQPPPKP